MVCKILIAIVIAIIGLIAYNGYIEDENYDTEIEDLLRERIELEYMKLRINEETRKFISKMEEARQDKLKK